MSCAHAYIAEAGHEGTFTIDTSAIHFGRGALAELGAQAQGIGGKRYAVFTDAGVKSTAFFEAAVRSLRDAGLDAVVFSDVHVEPTDASFMEAARFARDGRFDGYVSLGGGSTIDTCKAALLYATYPADFLTYVNKPVGAAVPVPGALPPHIACPTTSGTGSELTGIAVCDVLALRAKTGIASRRLRPTLAVIDPDVTTTLPGPVVAASGFDVLCHALESYTARPFVARDKPRTPAERPMSQGRNPWSDLGSAEALRLGGEYLVRAVKDASDHEARERLMWAATLAGVAFGNAGVHIPHAMAYAVAGLVHDFHMPGYPKHEPMVPHGVSVVVNAPATFRFTAATDPERHLAAASWLGEDVRGAEPNDAGELVARALLRLMTEASVPVSLDALGYTERDLGDLVGATRIQRRLLDNAPISTSDADLEMLFRRSFSPARPA